ncbi:thioredoxin family protein [Peribacillus sp. SCS-26]|uniref:thioredoxin family protein n=1 Tax=Paraperibacillus marinus TaxID=3115295 RepID=UPI0039057871
MRNLQNWLDSAMAREEYISSMTVHRENLEKVYQGFTLNEADLVRLEKIREQKLQSVILTADWCGDAMVNLPIFMHIAGAAGIQEGYLIRDDNLELMDQYLTNGKSRSIPIIIWLRPDGTEAGKWGPRAPEAEEQVTELKKDLPAKDDSSFEAAFQLFASNLSDQFTENKSLWKAISEDMISSLLAAAVDKK